MSHSRSLRPGSLSGAEPRIANSTGTVLQPSVGQGTVAIPHDCAPGTLPESALPSTSTRRLVGIDAARALALLGMMAVHLLSETTGRGNMSPAYVLSSGKSAALFAVLAGVGIAFTTGRTRRPTGRRWLGAMAEVAVRGLLIGTIGLTLGALVPVDRAAVILPFYGLLFILAIPFLRLPPAVLAVLAIIAAVAMPILSHDLRQGLPWVDPPNPTFGMLLEDPEQALQLLFLTGAYPALPWLAYVLAGLAVGRMFLDSRGVMLRLAALGLGLMVVANVATWFLMERLGGSTALTRVAETVMSRDAYTDILVWGATGTLPTDSPWWLAVLAPHTATPADLLFTMGLALAVIGLALTFALVAPKAIQPLAWLGRMPLTVYVSHLLLLTVPFLPSDGGALVFAIHLLLLGTFVVFWGRIFKRGPLEQLIWWIADHVDQLVGGRPVRSQDALPANAGGR